MTTPSVRLRLALLVGLVGLVGSGATLMVAYAVTSHAIAVAPIMPAVSGQYSVGADAGSGPGSEAAEADFKARQGEAERRIRGEMRAAILRPLRTRGLMVMGAATVASLACGWYLGGLTLRPLRRITDTARRIADRSLHERVALGRGRDEWWELGSTINGMLSRLDAAFAAQRQFVGNASHELKTPLAINQTLLDVAMSRPDAQPELLRLGETLLEVNARHERVVDGLLALARAEHGVADPQPVDLAHAVDGVLALLRPEAERLDLRLDSNAAPVVVFGDRILLDRLVQNLVQNAIRYNVRGGWVRLSAGAAGADAQLTVVNTGPVVAASRVPELFEPFQRATNRVNSARGSGLGLSIVRSVVQAHGGTVDAVAREEGGLEVTVSIPRRRR